MREKQRENSAIARQAAVDKISIELNHKINLWDAERGARSAETGMYM